ncbi:calcium-binding protein 7-like [Sinocyclocheilus grahami]|uniref:calcium-binding protein 7-like n=1 Tax=Sinocyclocheilus grahami TaxID=75366 RepID=UPI0007AC8E44|nr:PREDICTED: calcium-binding protein 7-like [Sinocyclocheilus grahami]
MPMHPVTSTLMYRGICTIPDILSYRAPVNLPEDEVEEIREAFKVFDRDGNGFISKQELGMAMRSLGYMPNEVELEVIIQRLDMDGDGQVDFEEFVTLLGPKLSAAGMPDKFNGTNFDSVFWKCDMQKLTVEELKRLLYETFCDHLTMKDIENIIMTEENHIENPEDCQVDIDRFLKQHCKDTSNVLSMLVYSSYTEAHVAFKFLRCLTSGLFCHSTPVNKNLSLSANFESLMLRTQQAHCTGL